MRTLLLLGLLAVSGCNGASDRLVSQDLIIEDTLPTPLTETPGSAARGEAVFINRSQGHCVICHQVAGLGIPFQGNAGPSLTDAGSRLSPEQLRLRIVDYQLIRDDTLMPSYYRIHDLYQVEEASLGEPILTAQDIEDLVAYLSALKD